MVEVNSNSFLEYGNEVLLEAEQLAKGKPKYEFGSLEKLSNDIRE